MKNNYNLYLTAHYTAFFILCISGAFIDDVRQLKLVIAVSLILMIISSFFVEKLKDKIL